MKEIDELKEHLRLNRKSDQKALYQEVLPRLISTLEALAASLEDLPDQDDGLSGEKYIPLRYSTVTHLEQCLLTMYQDNPNCNRIKAALIVLLDDLHGMSSEQIEQILKIEKEPQENQNEVLP